MLVRDWNPGDSIPIGDSIVLTKIDAQRIGIKAPRDTIIGATIRGNYRQPKERPHRQMTGDEADREGD